MIPKIIHYCWFGKGPKPPEMTAYIQGWRRLNPDYQVIEWNEHNTDLETCEYARQAYNARKFAFVSDYARGHALLTMGGVYLDTDVELVAPLDALLAHDAFIGFEHGNSIATSTMGFNPGHPLMRRYVQQYSGRNFIKADGTMDLTTNVVVMTKLVLDLGLNPNGARQVLDEGVVCLPMTILSPLDYVNKVNHSTSETIAIHHYAHSWGGWRSKCSKFVGNTIVTLFGNSGLSAIRQFVQWVKNITQNALSDAPMPMPMTVSAESPSHGRKPKVLIFTHAMHLGGVERSLIGMLGCMDPAKLDVDLLLLERGGDLLTQVPEWVRILPAPRAHGWLMGPVKSAFTPKGLPIAAARVAAAVMLRLRKSLGLPPGFLLARSHRYSMPFMPKVKGDYDLAISYMMPHDFVARKVSARRKVGWIHTDYTSVESGVAAAFEAKAWEEMNAIVAVSPEVAAAFKKTFPRLADRVSVIENILDPEWVRKRALEPISLPLNAPPHPGRWVFCSVGRFSFAKGFDIAVKAAYLLKNNGLSFRWFFVGYGPEENNLRSRIGVLGLSDEIIMTGALENPYPIMKSCDLYIQPSRYEGKSVSIREAQMLGKPVLASGYPTVRSQIEHEVDGFVAKAGPEGLAEAIIRLVQTANMRDKIVAQTLSRNYGNISEISKVMALIPPASD